jgi:sigma-B regulation protein RsbU (phosphoserine phosphatase)
VVGDVCGKGVPAALVMALTRALLRAAATADGLPERLLRDVNRHMEDMSASGPFVTMVYGVLDTASASFSYVRAGHELPLRWDASGVLLPPLLGLGHPLGLLPDPALDVQTVDLPPNSTLLLYSDGVTEATNAAGEFFGRERLNEAVVAVQPATAQGLCNHLIAALADFRGAAPQADDITLLAVRAANTR